MKVKPPISWFGGKRYMVNNILPMIPKHHIYVEPFGGAANVLLAKEPSKVEVYNDLYDGVVIFYKVLRDKKKFKELERLCELTPYSRKQYYECREIVRHKNTKSDVEFAWAFFVACRTAFSGLLFKSWGINLKASSRGMSQRTSAYISAVKRLEEVHLRLRRVQIENRDAMSCIKQYDLEDTLFYLDPPYIQDTRKHDKYIKEMNDFQHEQLIDYLVHDLKGMAILSGYKHKIYRVLDKNGWKRKEYKKLCYSAAKTRATKLMGSGNAMDKVSRIECLWISQNISRDNSISKGGNK